MRIIGPHRSRTQIELDPLEAYRRGRILDAMLRSALLPIPRGVYRGTFATFNRMDDERMLQVARRLNRP
jgi:hypothetical protein